MRIILFPKVTTKFEVHKKTKYVFIFCNHQNILWSLINSLSTSSVKSLKKSQNIKENDQNNNTHYYTVGQYITVSNSFYATLEAENRKNTIGKVLLKITLWDFSLFWKPFVQYNPFTFDILLGPNRFQFWNVQQGLEIHGLEEHGPWRYTVFNWIPKHLRYTVFEQKPWRYTVFIFMKKMRQFLSLNMK